jgi:hypothetical protein
LLPNQIGICVLCSVAGFEEIWKGCWTACESSEVIQSAVVSGPEAAKEG